MLTIAKYCCRLSFEALRRVNPDVPDEVLHHIAKPDHPSLIQSNRAFHETLIDGVPVEVDGEGGGAGDFGWPACPRRFADSQLIKKTAGYHQFHAVREAVRGTVMPATMPALPEGKRVEARKGGIVWHTQESGKSISMVCFAAKLMQQQAMQNPTLFVVTDRNDLDGQLGGATAGS